MDRRITAVGLLVPLVAVVALFVPPRDTVPSIAGRWQTEAPSFLVYDFSTDGAVFLVDGSESRQVFRYIFTDGDTIELYDGMGRIRRFTVTLKDDTMTLLSTASDIEAEVYKRISDDA